MARKPIPTGEDEALKLVLRCLAEHPKTIQEIADETTLARPTVENKLRKARQLTEPNKVVRLVIGPNFTLYVKSPLFSNRPDNSIPATSINRFALCVVTHFKANVEGMVESLKDLYDKQRWEQ